MSEVLGNVTIQRNIVLASTFPGMTEGEARRELVPGDEFGVRTISNTPPILRTYDQRLAGWLSVPAALNQCSRSNTTADINATAAAGLPNGDASHPFSSSTPGDSTRPRTPLDSAGRCVSTNSYQVLGDKLPVAAEDTPSSYRELGSNHTSRVKEFAVSKAVRRGDVIAVERPLVAVQSSQALPWVVACPGCLRHLGSLELQLAIASGAIGRAQAFRSCTAATKSPPPRLSPLAPHQRMQQEGTGTEEEEDKSRGGAGGVARDTCLKVDQGAHGKMEGGRKRKAGSRGVGLPPLDGLSERFVQPPVSCSAGCGAIYCGEICRERCWDLGHSVLCLGLVDDEEHPLVKHKVHALAHPDLEAPLLLAAELLIQVAQAVSSERRRARKSASKQTVGRANVSISTLCSSSGTAGRNSSSALECAGSPTGEGEDTSGGPGRRGVEGCGVAFEGQRQEETVRSPPAASSEPNIHCSGVSELVSFAHADHARSDGNSQYSDEAIATTELMGVFRRGILRDETSRAPDASVVEESWALLLEALKLRRTSSASDDKDIAVDPKQFTLLLSRHVHKSVVAGLAANLMEVEVEAPLVEYCEALVTQAADIQHRALQILEPAFAAMGGGADGQEPGAPSIRASHSTPLQDDGAKSKISTLRENRSAARLAWRCVEAAQNAARLLPPLSTRALLPALGLRLPHSCAPNARVPAGDRRNYAVSCGVGGGGGGGPIAGAAGWPLSVATIALRDLPAGSPLTCSWVDVSETFKIRMTLLKEHVTQPSDTPSSDLPPSLGNIGGVIGGDEGGRKVGDLPQAMSSIPCELSGTACSKHTALEDEPTTRKPRFGCGCSKCQVEGRNQQGVLSTSPSLSLEGHLAAARDAADEDRFDDAFDILQHAALLDPESGEVLYRAGVCAINQGRWSRALRLWREGLALCPDHPELKREAEKYHALAFWQDAPDGIQFVSGLVSDGEEGHDDLAPFSSPLPGLEIARKALPISGKGGGGGVDEVITPRANPGDSGGGNDDSSGHNERTGDIAQNLDIEFMGRGEWVCKTRAPLLSGPECAAVIAEAEETASAKRGGGNAGGGNGWGTARHYAVPTTDVAVRELPLTLAWFNHAMRTQIGPLIAAASALGSGELESADSFNDDSEEKGDLNGLRDAIRTDNGDSRITLEWGMGTGSTGDTRMRDGGMGVERDIPCGESVTTNGCGMKETDSQSKSETRSEIDSAPESTSQEEEAAATSAAFLRRLRVHDAFVVRYDSAAQRSLPLHTDQGELSLTITLNNSEEYEGGGTWFEGLGRAVRPEEAGHVVVFPGGDTVHGGREITRGVRYVLAVFLYEHWSEEEEGDQASEDDEEEEEEGGYMELERE